MNFCPYYTACYFSPLLVLRDIASLWEEEGGKTMASVLPCIHLSCFRDEFLSMLVWEMHGNEKVNFQTFWFVW